MRTVEAPPHIEVVDDETAAVLAAESGTDRLAIAAGMLRAARRMLESHLPAEHPGREADPVAEEVRRRLSHGGGSHRPGNAKVLT